MEVSGSGVGSALISFSQVHKSYKSLSTAKERILATISFGFYPKTGQKALTDINFQANAGEILGIIGRNGAGKSTLLKLLTGVSLPDSGKIQTQGKIRAILELGAGFNPELSGEENVYYSGLIWGYTHQEIPQLSEQVFSFSGLESYRKVPLKAYSTGMGMRLGFALATSIPPEILVVDEALAVGDASFQAKCLARFREFQSKGTLSIIVSHDLSLLRSICTRILVLEKGQIVFDGDPGTALENYMQILGNSNNLISNSNEIISSFEKAPPFWEVYMETSRGRNLSLYKTGEKATLCLKFKPKEDWGNVTVGFSIADGLGNLVFGTNTHAFQKEILTSINLEAKVSFHFPLDLLPGKYSLGVSIHKGESHAEGSYLWAEGVLDWEMEIGSLPKSIGIVALPIGVEVS